jgi:hypothetical protein
MVVTEAMMTRVLKVMWRTVVVLETQDRRIGVNVVLVVAEMKEYGAIHPEDRRNIQSRTHLTEGIAIRKPGTMTQVEVPRTRDTLM